ncbi:MAG TPA: hypothetical protein VGF57_03505, partial [Roseiarcus sp.]
MKIIDPRRENGLDSRPSNLDFVVFGLDFVAPGFGFQTAGLENVAPIGALLRMDALASARRREPVSAGG